MGAPRQASVPVATDTLCVSLGTLRSRGGRAGLSHGGHIESPVTLSIKTTGWKPQDAGHPGCSSGWGHCVGSISGLHPLDARNTPLRATCCPEAKNPHSQGWAVKTRPPRAARGHTRSGGSRPAFSPRFQRLRLWPHCLRRSPSPFSE